MDYSNRVYVPQHTPSREVKSEAEHNQIIREATLAERRRLTGLMAQGAPISISVDERDKFKTAAELSISERAGLTKRDNGNEYVGYSLLELARQSLIKAGLPAAEARENSMQMCGRALQTSDFPEILGNVANKALFAGWDGAGETWQEWCGIQAISDFKPTSILAVSEGSSLDEIPEGGEYKYGKRTESKEVVQLATYGKVFAITRQALINDDLSALSDIPTMHGEMANRKIGDTAYSILSNNAPMGDGIDLFHADHSNLVASGSGAAPGVATIAAGILAMGTQKDLQGLRGLNIRPVFFLAPKALEGEAEVFFRSNQFSDSDTVATDSSLASSRVNPYSGTYFQRIYDARMDDDVATKWYLAANKKRTVNLYFLDGVQKPHLETQDGWNTDGAEFKVRIDCAAKVVDYRGLFQNYGS